MDLASAQEASCSGLSHTGVTHSKWHHLQTILQAIISCSPGRCREVLPRQAPQNVLRQPCGSYGCVLISHSQPNELFWQQQMVVCRVSLPVSSLPWFSSCPPGRRLWSCPNLAFLLQRVSWGKEKEAERPCGGLTGTEENQEHGGGGVGRQVDQRGVRGKLMTC